MSFPFIRTCIAVFCAAFPIFAQEAQAIRAKQEELHRITCPGEPPGNLESLDCNFTQRQRLTQFVAGSLTDQALVGATFFGAIAHFRGEPPEWKQDWNGLGYRVGSRYAQNLTKGLTTYTIGFVMQTDPRHVSYVNDPGTKLGPQAPGVWPRVGHAFVDWLTVRRSSADGN